MNSPGKYLGDLTFNFIFSVNFSVHHFLVLRFRNTVYIFIVFPDNKQICNWNCKATIPENIQPNLKTCQSTLKHVISPYKAQVNIENITCGGIFQHTLQQVITK